MSENKYSKKSSDGYRKNPESGIRKKNPEDGIRKKYADGGIRGKKTDDRDRWKDLEEELRGGRQEEKYDRKFIPDQKSIEAGYYMNHACEESFVCRNCGHLVEPEGAGTDHRNHCPKCLYSVHVDNEPGDRASECGGKMEPIAVWVRKNGEWAIIHRCNTCGALSSNRIAADDNPLKLMSIAMRPISQPPFPLERMEEMTRMFGGNDDSVR